MFALAFAAGVATSMAMGFALVHVNAFWASPKSERLRYVAGRHDVYMPMCIARVLR